MTPFYADDWLTVYGGDCREVLASLPADSVDCVVTSPPYWGLRDYGNDGQLGLERTPEEYVANLVAVFAEVRRVLKPSGTCWLNLGDSYGAGGGAQVVQTKNASHGLEGMRGARTIGAKQLAGIPWRVAFALQADGWYLRSDIIWSKPNPMPESVTDRPTKAHEYLFLLSKSPRYYFDADAVREPHIEAHLGRYKAPIMDNPKEVAGGGRPGGASNTGGMKVPHPIGRNIRSVWTIATRPYPGAHFAVFPPELPERCIKAGSSEKGVCPECGAPWERVVERERTDSRPGNSVKARELYGGNAAETGRGGDWSSVTTGWRPTCAHEPCPLGEGEHRSHKRHGGHAGLGLRYVNNPVPAVIFDPFAGSGTVGMVANRLSRRAILIDLNPEYLKQQMSRNAQTPLGLGAA